MKIIHKIIVVFILLFIIVGGLLYDSFYIAPSRFITRYETVESTRIPPQLNDINILFFSDLHYGLFMNNNRLKKLITTINNANPDVVIFGGDLLNLDKGGLNDEDKTNLINLLASIEAPLGKFAVYGDYDHKYLDTINDILNKSNFEILQNKTVQIRNKLSQSINLVGLDSEAGGMLDTLSAYEQVVRTSYTITVCHTPDTVNKVPGDTSDLFLSGHTLGGQAFYLFDSLYKPDYSNYFFRGKHNINDTILLDISSGTGTIIKDIRWLSNAEVVMYRLKYKEVKQAQ